MAERRSAVDRPRTLSGAQGAARFVVGVDVGATKVRAGLVDVHRGSVGTMHSELLPQLGADAVVRAIIRAAAAADPLGRAHAIGLAVAAQVDGARGVVRYAPNLGWQEVALARKVAGATGLPVQLENDARAAVYGEWRHGRGRGARALFGLVVGTGVGGGFIDGGRPVRGAVDAAGEVGHLTVVDGGRPCHCPNRGCLEAYVGGWAIAERAAERLADEPRRGRWLRKVGGGSTSAKLVLLGARANDPLCVALLEETARFLASGVVSIVNAYNPDRLVLSGGVLEHWPGIARRLQREIRLRCQPPAADCVRVLRSVLGPAAPILGAASLVGRAGPRT